MERMGKTASIGYDLPEELMIEILVRLPVKSLLKFKCVCKQWCDLIQSPNFITNHFHTPNNHTRLLILHKTHSIYRDSDSGYERPDEEFSLIGLSGETLAHEYTVNFIQVIPYKHAVIGPVNGLLLLQYYGDNDDVPVGVWNPATTEFRPLPAPTPTFSPFHVFGFGFDPLTNDYKVIYISIIRLEPSGRPIVALYTLATDSWRLIEAEASPLFPSFLWCLANYDRSRAIYLNGANYWHLNRRNQSRIALFDFRSEVFREIKAPDKANDNGKVASNLVPHNDDSIALLVTEFVPASSFVLESIEMWVMKQGEEGCWNKHFTFELGPHLHLCKPLGFWKNDYEIFFETDSDQLVLYNTNTHNIMDLGVRGESTQFFLAVYKESLVSVGGQKASKRDKLHAMVQYFFTRGKLHDMV